MYTVLLFLLFLVLGWLCDVAVLCKLHTHYWLCVTCSYLCFKWVAIRPSTQLVRDSHFSVLTEITLINMI